MARNRRRGEKGVGRSEAKRARERRAPQGPSQKGLCVTNSPIRIDLSRERLAGETRSNTMERVVDRMTIRLCFLCARSLGFDRFQTRAVEIEGRNEEVDEERRSSFNLISFELSLACDSTCDRLHPPRQAPPLGTTRVVSQRRRLWVPGKA